MIWSIRKKIVENAKKALAPFEINWLRYSKGEVLHEVVKYSSGSPSQKSQHITTFKREPSCVTVCVVFTNKRTKAQIVVHNIYYNEETGEILQCGRNYGNLCL